MRSPALFAAALVTVLATFGCSGAKLQGAKAPEADPWADYHGTFAAGVPKATPEEKAAKAADAKPADNKTADAKPSKSSDDKADKSDKTDKTAKASSKSGSSRPAADSGPRAMEPDKAPAAQAKAASNDARSLYGDGGDASADDAAPAAAPAKKSGKKKGGGAKKSAGKAGAPATAGRGRGAGASAKRTSRP